MTGMNDFFTREAANEGIKLPLTLPDGMETDHYLVIRGVDSDQFREAEIDAKRNAVFVSDLKDQQTRNEFLADGKRSLVASLVADWSFEQECTVENVKAFLKEAPQIADQIDHVAAKRSLFFGKRLSNSNDSQNQSSSSTAPPKALQ